MTSGRFSNIDGSGGNNAMLQGQHLLSLFPQVATKNFLFYKTGIRHVWSKSLRNTCEGASFFKKLLNLPTACKTN